MGLDFADADGVDVVEGGGEGDGSLDVWGAGFVFEGWVVVGGGLEGDFFDHFTAAAPWGEGVEEVEFAPEDADAGGGVGFVAGEYDEVCSEGLDVDGHVGDGLGGIDEDGGAVFFGGGGHFNDGVDGAEGV